MLDEAARPSPWWWISGTILYTALAYTILTADGGFSVLLLVLFVAVAIYPFVLGGQINAYELDDRPPDQRPSVVWHVSHAPDLVAAVVGDEIFLDPARCRLMARLWTPNTLRFPRRAVYVFGGTPSEDALAANVTAGRRGVLLELDAAGLADPWHRRGSAIASTNGYRGRVISTTDMTTAIVTRSTRSTTSTTSEGDEQQ